MIPVHPDDGSGYLFHPDYLAGAEEIIIHETLNHQAVGWRISKERGRSQEYQYLADFDTFIKGVRRDVYARIETIQTSCLRLNNFLENVKICSAQCKNLLQICSKGVANMIESYIAVFKDDNYMWGLYTTKKLRHLVSSLDRLISSLESIEELLQACGPSQWCRMGLVVSAFEPSPRLMKKTLTKFDLLIKELRWNLDTIHSILDSTEDVQLNWNDDKCGYVPEKKEGTGIADEVGMELVECGTDVGEARADLLFLLKDGAVSRKKNFRLIWVLSSSFLSVLVGRIVFRIWNGSLISGKELDDTLALYFVYFVLLGVFGLHWMPEVFVRDFFCIHVPTFLRGHHGRKWNELHLEGGAPARMFTKIVLLLFCGVSAATIVRDVCYKKFENFDKESLYTFIGVFLPLSRVQCTVYPGCFLLGLSTFICELSLFSISAWEKGSTFTSISSSMVWIGPFSWALVNTDFHLLEIGVLSREYTVFRIRVIYLFRLLGGLIGILFKIQNTFISNKEAATSPLFDMTLGFLIPLILTFLGISSVIGSVLVNLILCRPWLTYVQHIFVIESLIDIPRFSKNEIVSMNRSPKFMLALLLSCWTVTPVICVADLVFVVKNGLFHIKNALPIPFIEIFVLDAICFVLLLRAAEPLEDWLERLGRKHYPQYGERRYFEEDVLKRRVESSGETNKSVDFSTAPIYFEIDHTQLKLETEIAGDRNSSRVIYRGTWRGQEVAIATTQNLAVDEYNRKSQSGEIQEETKKTAALMLRLHHPNIVDFFGYAFKPDKSSDSGGSDDEPVTAAGYLVMELMQCDLRGEIDRLGLKQPGRPFPDDVAVDILLQIAGAMSHIHDCGVLHRDLKAKNCVVSQRISSQSSSLVHKFYTVKLIDFDISKSLLDQYATDHTLMRGTARWMAPEVWGIGTCPYVPGVPGQKAPYDTSIDVYSFGMTCYEVIAGKDPFQKYRKNHEIRSALEKGERPEFPPGMSCPKALDELMSRCWAQDPFARPNFKEIEKALWTIKYELELQ